MSNTQLLINQLVDWLVVGCCSSVYFAIINATMSLYSIIWKGHGKLTEGTLTALKVDRKLKEILWLHGKLMESPLHARKVDGRSCGFTESGWNFDRRLYVHPRDFLWNSINFLCMYRTFHHFQVHREDSPSNNGVITAFLSTSSVSTSTFRVSAGPSINFPYVCRTFYQLS